MHILLRSKQTSSFFFGGGRKNFDLHARGARSAVGMKKETECCEEATSHDIIAFVERPRRACRTRPLISCPGLSNHSLNLWAAGEAAANISAVAATDEVLTDGSFRNLWTFSHILSWLFKVSPLILKTKLLFFQPCVHTVPTHRGTKLTKTSTVELQCFSVRSALAQDVA